MADKEGKPLIDQTIVFMANDGRFLCPRKNTILSMADYVYFADRAGAELVMVQKPDAHRDWFELDLSDEGDERMVSCVAPHVVELLPEPADIEPVGPSGPTKVSARSSGVATPERPASAYSGVLSWGKAVGRVSSGGTNTAKHKLDRVTYVVGGVPVTVFMDGPVPPDILAGLQAIESHYGYFKKKTQVVGDPDTDAVGDPPPLPTRADLVASGFSLLDGLSN
jgi:hypothetical protein